MLWPPAQYKKGLQASSLGTTPRVSTFCLLDISQASLFCICLLQGIKINTGGGNGLGTRLLQAYF